MVISLIASVKLTITTRNGLRVSLSLILLPTFECASLYNAMLYILALHDAISYFPLYSVFHVLHYT